MESVKSLVCCLIPGLRRNPSRNREEDKETTMEKRRNKIKQISFLKVSRTYPLRRARIIDSVTFDCSRILIVWGESQDLLRSEVITKLHSFGKLIRIQDRWSVKDNGNETWKGVIAEYGCARDAETASAELPNLVRHSRSTMLKTVMETLLDCEILYLQTHKHQEPTKLVMSRRVPFRSQEVEDLHIKLSMYGDMQTFFINHRQTTIGAVCEVTYPYLTHAYLAFLMTDAQKTYRGILNASLEKTERNIEILKDVKDSIIYLHQCYFPK